MCFAPQRRALFRDLNLQKWSEAGVFCTFWLRNVLRATTACTFSTSQLPKVVRTPQFLTHFTSKCASRHNGVQLFISHLPRCLRTRRFSEPTFQPSGATKPRKNTVFCDFPTFSRTCIFFLLIFSLLTLLPADCFFISPYCRKFDFQTSFDNWLVVDLPLLVGGWPTPLKNMKVSWAYYSQCMGKMFQTTNQTLKNIKVRCAWIRLVLAQR